MSELRFVDVGPDDEKDLRRWFELVTAVHDADRAGDALPGFSTWAGQVRRPSPGSESHLVLAEVDGEVVGWFAQWLSTRENTDATTGEVEVHPAHRRRGYGRAMVDEWTRRAREMGRTRMIAEGMQGTGAAFAAALGFRAVLADTQRRLDLETADTAALAALLEDACAHAGDYSLVQWTGGTPEKYLPGMAALESRMTIDAPMDDLTWEQEVYDADRLREQEQVWLARGTRRYTTVAVHDATGDVAGSTSVGVHEDADEGAYQWQTIVAPEHRGHRLGLLLKLENLALLRTHEPAVRTVDTWNADSNGPMLRVNLAMGFEVVRQWAEYERAI